METPLWHYKFGNEDVDLLRQLNNAGVSYIIIGGAAVAHYGGREAHEIDDLDILVDNTEENAKKFAQVINQAASNAGVPLATRITQDNFTRPKVQFPLKFAPFYCEFQTPTNHDEFVRLGSNAVRTAIMAQSVLMLSRSDLIEMKRNCIKDYGNSLAKHQKDLEYLMS